MVLTTAYGVQKEIDKDWEFKGFIYFFWDKNLSQFNCQDSGV